MIISLEARFTVEARKLEHYYPHVLKVKYPKGEV